MSPTLEETLRLLLETEMDATRAVLGGQRDGDTAVKLAVGAGQRAGRTFLKVFQTVACRAGCSFCCHGVQVDVTAPEALTIARGFRETLQEVHLAVVRDRVRRHADAIRRMSVTERHRARTPCPLLDETSNRCSVHEARPMRCRAHHSLNVEDCKAASFDTGEQWTVNRYPDVMDGHEAMIRGQEEVLVAAGLDAREFELSLALEVALDHEDAAARWARGERLFDAAAFEWADEP